MGAEVVQLDGALGRQADHGLHLEREEKHQLNLTASNWIQVDGHTRWWRATHHCLHTQLIQSINQVVDLGVLI